jgi:isopenicillin-N epimerase
MSESLKSLFLLDPNVIFLNHGSFGACPQPVFDDYQRWQRELERQPVEFLARRSHGLLAEARAALAGQLGAEADDLVFFPNPTTAVNMVGRSLGLGPGDELLTTDHEYGAMERTWRYLAGRRGFTIVRQPIPLPLASPGDFVERFWAGVTERTRAIFLSHITSLTALIFPVQEICRRARQGGILTIVDGAHAPGQIALNLDEVGADIYTGAAHKWMLAPKGCAFLHVRRELQDRFDPLVVSWGYECETPGPSRFIDYHEYQGTRDIAAFLAAPAAIRFQQDHNWDCVRAECRQLLAQAVSRLRAVTGLEAACPDSPKLFNQMAVVRLPGTVDCQALKKRLYDECMIEVPVYRWNDQPMLRISVQGYNTPDDLDALVEALGKML